MKTIDTLVTDIYNLMDPDTFVNHDKVLGLEYATAVSAHFKNTLTREATLREKGKLWASDIGKKCLRQHWYNFNLPESGAPLGGPTRFKFLYGNLLEEAVLYLAKEAGHLVTHEQERVELDLENGWVVSGKLDAVIDGVLIDVKSTSSYGYKRYCDGITPSNDSFGYIEQLSFYSAFGPTAQPVPGFVWIDKQNGHIKYTPVDALKRESIEGKAKAIASAIDKTEAGMVSKAYVPVAYGGSGNESLPITCSYCPFNKTCWSDANGGVGLRTFLYSQGPVHFTTITREPKTQEITQ